VKRLSVSSRSGTKHLIPTVIKNDRWAAFEFRQLFEKAKIQERNQEPLFAPLGIKRRKRPLALFWLKARIKAYMPLPTF